MKILPTPFNGLRVDGDSTAIGLSALCLVHCVSLPILSVLLPWLAWLEAHESLVHRGLLILIVPISVWALSRGCNHHGRKRIVYAGVLAMTALVGAVALEPAMPVLALPLTLLGSGILIGSHVWNLRWLSRCRATLEIHT